MAGGTTNNTSTTKEHAENNVKNHQEWNYFGKDTKNENTHDYSEVKGMDIGGKVVMLDNGYNGGVQVFSKTLPDLQLMNLADVNVKHLIALKGDVNFHGRKGQTINIGTMDASHNVNIESVAGSKINIGGLTLEPTGHLNVNVEAGGEVNLRLHDLTGGKGLNVATHGGVLHLAKYLLI